MRGALAAALLALLLAPHLGRAAERIVSSAAWRTSGNEVGLRVLFPRSTALVLRQPGQPVPATEAVERYVFKRVHVQEGQVPCSPIDLGYDLGRIDPLYFGPDLFAFEIIFRCPHGTGTLTLRNDALFDLPVPHIGLASIRLNNAPTVTRLLTPGSHTLQIIGGHPPAPSSAGAYAWLGAQHLFTDGLDLCAVCGLLITVRRRSELESLALGLLGGYLAAALAAGAGRFILGAPGAQAWEGAFVLFTAALLIGRTPSHLSRAALGLALTAGVAALVALLRGHGDVALTLVGAGAFGACLLTLWRTPGVAAARWALPALALGAVDGFTLPSELAPVRALAQVSTPDILAFNLGSVAAALVLFAGVAILRWLLERHASILKAPVMGDLLAASLAGLGAFYVLAV